MDYLFRGDHNGPRQLTQERNTDMAANDAFSAPVNYWGTIAGLTQKSSSDGKSSSVAEAPNEYGDTVAHAVYGEVIAPSTEYAVTGSVKLSDIVLGSVHDVGNKKVMLTTVSINTQAGQPPTVSISGVEVESGATAKRTYPCSGTLTPRSKSQDVAGAFAASEKFTAINTTFSVDPHVQTVEGTPVASDCSHGRVEVQGTMTDDDGTGAITAGTGFTITAAEAESDPDAGYQTKTATATKFLTGTEGSSS